MNEPDPAVPTDDDPREASGEPPYRPPIATTPPAQAPPPSGERSATLPPPAPPAVPAGDRKGMSSGWKWFIGIMVVVLLLGFMGCASIGALAALMGGDPTVALGDSVAVIHVDGVIAGTGSSMDGVISPEEFLGYLDQAASDPNIKAVLLRVDSPGGTVAASQEIATEVARLAEEKPVVASVGDVGASGAYMIASQCDEIWAQPTSAVGSIGVITQIPNLAGLLDKLGIEFTVLTAGEYKDAGSPYRSLTATETLLIQREIDIAYDEFIRMVAEGRGLDEAEVREMASGWAWSGITAQEMGLVDELGTYNDALDAAADLGGIEGDYEIIVYDGYDYSQLLRSLIGLSSPLDPLGSLGSDGGLSAPAVPK